MVTKSSIRKVKAATRLATQNFTLGVASLKDFLVSHEALRINSYGLWDKNPWSFQGNWFFQFIQHVGGKPVVLNNLRPDVSFFSVFGDRDFSRGGAKKIFFTGENVHSAEKPKYRVFEDHGLSEVDLAIGFDELDARNYIRFPLWILYFFKPQSTKDDVAEVVRKFNSVRYEKTRFCSLVARKDFNGIRKSIFDAVGKIGPIDSAGALFHNDDRLVTKFGNDKIGYLKQYRFNICPENSLCPGYITEKLFESLFAGCLPIYWGPADIEGGILNPKWIVRWDDNNHAVGMDRIRELQNSRHEMEELYRKPKLTDSAVDVIWSYFTGLSQRMEDVIS